MGSRARRAAAIRVARSYHDDQRVLFRCRACDRYTVTVLLHPGRPLDAVPCRAVAECTGESVSLGRPDPWPDDAPQVPSWEWYRPDTETSLRLRQQGGALWRHVRAGGLMIRPRPGLR